MSASLSIEVTVPDGTEYAVLASARNRWREVDGAADTDLVDLTVSEALQYMFNSGEGVVELEQLGVQWFTITNGKEES